PAVRRLRPLPPAAGTTLSWPQRLVGRRPPRILGGGRGAERAAQRSAGDGDVVEGDDVPAGQLLAVLVALAGDHHHIARGGSGERVGDRGVAVDDRVELSARDLARPGEDLLDDRRR